MTTLYPPANANFNLRVPMPIPRTPSAPLFNGKYIDDFLDQITLHAHQAGETDMDKMVRYILSYSSDKVKDTIRFMDEFDLTKTQLSWSAAKDVLVSLYGSNDKPVSYTEEELKEFCKVQSAKSSFSKTSDIENYYRDFITIASSLKKKGTLKDEQVNYYFILGLPHAMKEWFLAATPETKRTRDDPPSIPESLKILHARYDKKSLLYEEWNADTEDKAKPVFNEYGNRVSTSRSQMIGGVEQAQGFPTTGNGWPNSANAPGKVPTNEIDELTKRMESLALAIQTIQGNSYQSGDRRPPQTGPKRCFMCGMPCGQDGVHPTGPRFCPETNRLIADHLITFDAQRTRYTLPGGGDLPRIPYGWTGGVASYLRHLSTNTATSNKPRDDPPHLNRSTSTVGLMFDNEEVLTGNVFALDSLPYDAYPTLRSGRDTSNRLDPRTQTGRPDRVRQAREPREQQRQQAPQPTQNETVQQQPQQHPQPPPPQQVRFTPDVTPTPLPPHQTRFAPPGLPRPAPTQPAQTPAFTIPPPTNPVNRQDGWKGSRPSNQKTGGKDVEMKDPKQPNAQYHFTSKVQDYANAENMLSQIGGMKVEVPLFQLLGLSPQLSKLMTENTRTKREYGVPKDAKSAEYFDWSEPHVSVGATFGQETTERHAYVEPDEALNDFVFRCSNAAARIPTNRFFAMTVGDIKVSINGVEFTAMIDTGSELNVAGDHLPEAAGLAMDFDGMRWSLKGINGDYERLRGCSVDTPMRIGGRNFTHHIFISQYPIGRHDIILGQPFLQEFSARIDYERGDHCKLYLWEDGNRKHRPTLMISITDPNNPRNATAIRHNGKPSSSYVQEVQDYDDDDSDFHE